MTKKKKDAKGEEGAGVVGMGTAGDELRFDL